VSVRTFPSWAAAEPLEAKEHDMSNYLLAYTGGAQLSTPEEQAEAMAAWGAWFGALGGAVVDGGNPVGAAVSIAADGSTVTGGASGLTGYSILSADSLAVAVDLAKGCPLLAGGGSVEVYEIVPAM
jgi:hypothetical protein